jgi:transketolase
VLAPCDPLECIEATRWCAKHKEGPVYLRIGKAGESNLTAGAEPFVFGKLRHLQPDADVRILSYGVITTKALEVAKALAERGQSVSVASSHTVKPLDRDGVIEALKHHTQVIVIEEHVPEGGLASRTKQMARDVKADAHLYAQGRVHP